MPQIMDMLEGLQQEHAQSAARYQKALAAGKTIATVRSQMDSLSALGDTVTQEDVIKAAGKLVASGIQPTAVASLLADMPPDGQALQAWVKTHDQDLQQREAQIKLVTDASRHAMGLSAMHVLQADAVAERMGLHGGAQGAAPMAGEGAPSANPLTNPSPLSGGQMALAPPSNELAPQGAPSDAN